MTCNRQQWIRDVLFQAFVRSTPGRQLLDNSHEMAEISFNEHKSWHPSVASRIVWMADKKTIKDLQGSLGVSLTHYSKLGLRTLVVVLACYPMTISLLQDITDWEFLDLSWREILSCSVFHYRLRRRSSMTGSSWKTGWFDGKKPPLQRWVSSLAVSTFFVVESLGLGASKVPGPSPAPHPSYPGSWAWNGSSCCRSGTLFESCRRYCHRGESLDSSENLPPKLHQKATGIRRTRRASLGKSTRTSCKTECLRQLFPSRHGSKLISR